MRISITTHAALVSAEPRKRLITTLPDVQRLDEPSESEWRGADAPEPRICCQPVDSMNEPVRQWVVLLKARRIGGDDPPRCTAGYPRVSGCRP